MESSSSPFCFVDSNANDVFHGFASSDTDPEKRLLLDSIVKEIEAECDEWNGGRSDGDGRADSAPVEEEASSVETASAKKSRDVDVGLVSDQLHAFFMSEVKKSLVDSGFATQDLEESDSAAAAEEAEDSDGDDDEPVLKLNIVIHNVACNFDLGCQLDLLKIATEGINIEYKTGQSSLNMYLRGESFNMTAKIFSSGKVSCRGANSEDNALVGARRIARSVQRLGFDVGVKKYRVVNVLATCALPFGIKIVQFAESHKAQASYEPELSPGVNYKVEDIKANASIFSTGMISITAPSEEKVDLAVQHIYPKVYEFLTPKIENP